MPAPLQRHSTRQRQRTRRSTRQARPPEHKAGFIVPAPRLMLFAVMLVGLGLRLLGLSHQPWVTIDGTEYIRFAEALMEGVPFVSQYAPGYPALIAIAKLVISDRVLAAGLVSVACGALLPLPVWWLARSAVGPRWAVLPALLSAVHPELVRFSAVTMSESAYILALYAGLALAAAGPALAGGLAMGAAFAVRPEALLPALALAVRGGQQRLRGHVKGRALALGLAGFLIVAVPCWVYFHATHGVWTLTPKIEALRAPSEAWIEDEVSLGTPAPAAERFGLVQRIRVRGPEAMRSYPANAPLHARSLLQLWPLPLLVLAAWGLTRRRGIEAIPLLHILALPLFAVSEQHRFVLPLVPALAILATIPIANVAGRAPRVRVWRIAMSVVLAAGIAWTWVTYRDEFTKPFDAWLGSQRDAAVWLAGVSSKDDVVQSRKPFVAFYAGRPYQVIPDVPYDDIIDDAVRRGTRYLVLPERVTHVFRPQLAPLLTDRAFYEREPRLELVYVGGYTRGYDVFIFRVLRAGEQRSGRAPHIALKQPGEADL